MACPVQQVNDAPGELAGYYGNPPDGVRANMILSLDGAAEFDGLAGPLSNPTDQMLLRSLRLQADVVLVGAGTARAERYGPVRYADGRALAHPQIAVVTRTGNLPASLFADGGRPMAVTTAEVARRRPGLMARADLLIAGEHSVDLAGAIERLQARGLRRILCEGGPLLLDELINADLIDEMCLTISPTLAGGPPVGHVSAPALKTPTRLRLAHALTADDYVFLRYRR